MGMKKSQWAAMASCAPAGKDSTGGLLFAIDSFCMSVASLFPFLPFKSWVSAYFRPEETFEYERKNTGWLGLLGNVSLALAVYGTSTMFSAIMAVYVFPNPLVGKATIPIIALGTVALLVLLCMAFFISAAISFGVARGLGGNGGFVEQTRIMALQMGGYFLLAMPLAVLGAVPYAGVLFGMAHLLLLLYWLYAYYLLLRKVHGLSLMRTLAVYAAPIAALVLLLALVTLVL
jgi:hypothetical protein